MVRKCNTTNIPHGQEPDSSFTGIRVWPLCWVYSAVYHLCQLPPYAPLPPRKHRVHMHAMREASSDNGGNSKAGWTFPQQMCHLFKYFFFHLWIILPSSRVSHAKTKRPWEWLPRPFSSLRKRPVNGQQPDLLCKSKLTNPISASKRDLKWGGGSALMSPFVERCDILSWSEGSLMHHCCL